MISYYKFQNSYFKLDSEKTFFNQVNDSSNQKSINYGTASPIIEVLHTVKLRDNWIEITEEEFNTVKAEVVAILSTI